MPKWQNLNLLRKKNILGCMPIEVMAQRGFKTMLFGPMKPVDWKILKLANVLIVIQLRQDAAAFIQHRGLSDSLEMGRAKNVFSG